ncbi:MAG: hypothetical protein JW836_01245 [Deltaproteobacteria bacterium]|nr:hypothetical protein [Deltaproteobacteria bacterium]
MMNDTYDLRDIAAKIESLKKTALELRDLGENFPALYRNARRILAGVRMLEINISDISDLTDLEVS